MSVQIDLCIYNIINVSSDIQSNKIDGAMHIYMRAMYSYIYLLIKGLCMHAWRIILLMSSMNTCMRIAYIYMYAPMIDYIISGNVPAGA